ncbi:MAG: CHAT domain-containing protein, partial [Nocardioidaceae bacterium]
DGMHADLDMAATHLSPQLRATVHSALGGRLAVLAEHLVAPIAHDLADKPLVVVPSGALAGVPWTLLPGLTGRPLTVPRSASSWLRARDHHIALRSAGFVAGPRVRRAAEEVDRAAKAWDVATVLPEGQAKATTVGHLAASVDVFHVAAHGRHSADNPLFSGLELSDGPWFGYDIDQLSAIPSTVILSACELGRSSVRWGEETIGMTVAWLHAGVRSVIASPASVDDDVACAVLAATHHYLAAGDSPSHALASAMSEVRGAVPAPFVCFGSGW